MRIQRESKGSISFPYRGGERTEEEKANGVLPQKQRGHK